MDELLKMLNKMEAAPEKVGKKALDSAGMHVKKVEARVAESVHQEYSQRVGAKALKKYGVRKRKGSQVVDIGIRGKLTKSQKRKDKAAKASGASRATYWDKVKGLIMAPLCGDTYRTTPLITGTP